MYAMSATAKQTALGQVSLNLTEVFIIITIINTKN
jgi:hypothetical protein